ncbi:ISL3 family transposase [Nocardia vinacea]
MRVLFPHLDGLRIEVIRAAGSTVRVEAATGEGLVGCPGCGMLSGRVHSRYRRRLSDTSITGREVVIGLRIRRLFCDNFDCGKTTFAEQVPQLAARHARRTLILQRMLCAVALALGGRAGARLTRQLAATVSRMTLPRQIRALPDPQHPVPRVLGVDDFALRRGHIYGTILIDMQTRRPIEVLDDRTANTLTAWLRAHPGVEIVCRDRDRAGAYAEAAAAGAPEAVQVADRWHIWHNLGEAVERTVARHRASLTAATTDPEPQELPDIAQASAELHCGPVAPHQRQDRTAVRTRQRWAQVHALLAQDTTIRAISRELGLARGTARRFARAESADELLVNNRTGYRISVLEAYKPDLHRRWNEGCTNATQLFEEIKARGYQGSEKLVRKYLQPFRSSAHIPAPPPKPPTVRKVVSWIMTNPATIAPEHRARLDSILAASPELAALTGHVRGFAEIMGQRRGRDLEQWMAAVDADDQPALHSFVRGLRRDQDAGHRRPDQVLEQWNSRRARQPHQNAQTANVRPRENRPTPQANPIERLSNPDLRITKIVPDPVLARHRHHATVVAQSSPPSGIFRWSITLARTRSALLTSLCGLASDELFAIPAHPHGASLFQNSKALDWTGRPVVWVGSNYEQSQMFAAAGSWKTHRVNLIRPPRCRRRPGLHRGIALPEGV